MADAQFPKLNASESRIVNALEIRLTAILDDRITKLEEILEKRVTAIETTINNLQKENNILTESVRALESKFLKLESNSRKGNFIIKGLPEDKYKTIQEAVAAVGQAIDVHVDVQSCFRLGKPRNDNSPRPILVKSTDTCASNILRSAKKLKVADVAFRKVFIDRDYPPEMVTALGRLRKKAYDHRQANPNSRTSIRNGKLFIDDVLVDEVK